mgnify:CR=1 FL=1
MRNFPIDPVTFIYGAIAVCGGVARYLRGYVDGAPFSIRIFFASAFVSGFGGWMFAVLGESISMPHALLFVMAGVGGLFSDQTMKFIFEYVQGKTQ